MTVPETITAIFFYNYICTWPAMFTDIAFQFVSYI